MLAKWCPDAIDKARAQRSGSRQEKDALHAEARGYGISVSAYLRILAIRDREAQQRAELRAKCYPDQPIGND